MFNFSFMQNLKIGARLAIGFGAMGFFMLVILVTGLLVFRDLNERVANLVQKDWRQAQTSNEIMRLFNANARNSFAAIVVTDSAGSAMYIANLLKNRQQITDILAEMERIATEGKGKELLAKIKEVRKPYVATANKINKLVEENRRDEAMQVMVQERLPALEVLLQAIQDLNDYQAAQVDASGRVAAETYVYSRNAMIGVGLLVLVVGSMLAYFIARHITRSTARLQHTVQRVADGDYTARAQLETGDELGVLGRAFDGMLNERVGALAQKEKENEALNTSIMDLLRSVSKLSRGDLTIKAPVREDITGALGDAINAMSDATAKTLGGVNSVSHEVRSASQGGRDTVLSTAKGMNEIRGTIQETGKRIKRLGERSQEITGIVKLIDDIAERTSVLALNANMQAAMAGEAGRGFRVVADEVQRLAERSKEATDQISKLVSNIQTETNETIATMDRAISEVVKGGELAEQAARQVTHLDDLGGQLIASVQAFTLPPEYAVVEGAAANRRAA
jgi:methyl-accepting chemotaxis protein